LLNQLVASADWGEIDTHVSFNFSEYQTPPLKFEGWKHLMLQAYCLGRMPLKMFNVKYATYTAA